MQSNPNGEKPKEGQQTQGRHEGQGGGGTSTAPRRPSRIRAPAREAVEGRRLPHDRIQSILFDEQKTPSPFKSPMGEEKKPTFSSEGRSPVLFGTPGSGEGPSTPLLDLFSSTPPVFSPVSGLGRASTPSFSTPAVRAAEVKTPLGEQNESLNIDVQAEQWFLGVLEDRLKRHALALEAAGGKVYQEQALDLEFPIETKEDERTRALFFLSREALVWFRGVVATHIHNRGADADPKNVELVNKCPVDFKLLASVGGEASWQIVHACYLKKAKARWPQYGGYLDEMAVTINTQKNRLLPSPDTVWFPEDAKKTFETYEFGQITTAPSVRKLIEEVKALRGESDRTLDLGHILTIITEQFSFETGERVAKRFLAAYRNWQEALSAEKGLTVTDVVSLFACFESVLRQSGLAEEVGLYERLEDTWHKGIFPRWFPLPPYEKNIADLSRSIQSFLPLSQASEELVLQQCERNSRFFYDSAAEASFIKVVAPQYPSWAGENEIERCFRRYSQNLSYEGMEGVRLGFVKWLSSSLELHEKMGVKKPCLITSETFLPQEETGQWCLTQRVHGVWQEGGSGCPHQKYVCANQEVFQATFELVEGGLWKVDSAITEDAYVMSRLKQYAAAEEVLPVPLGEWEGLTSSVATREVYWVWRSLSEVIGSLELAEQYASLVCCSQENLTQQLFNWLVQIGEALKPIDLPQEKQAECLQNVVTLARLLFAESADQPEEWGVGIEHFGQTILINCGVNEWLIQLAGLSCLDWSEKLSLVLPLAKQFCLYNMSDMRFYLVEGYLHTAAALGEKETEEQGWSTFCKQALTWMRRFYLPRCDMGEALTARFEALERALLDLSWWQSAISNTHKLLHRINNAASGDEISDIVAKLHDDLQSVVLPFPSSPPVKNGPMTVVEELFKLDSKGALTPYVLLQSAETLRESISGQGTDQLSPTEPFLFLEEVRRLWADNTSTCFWRWLTAVIWMASPDNESLKTHTWLRALGAECGDGDGGVSQLADYAYKRMSGAGPDQAFIEMQGKSPSIEVELHKILPALSSFMDEVTQSLQEEHVGTFEKRLEQATKALKQQYGDGFAFIVARLTQQAKIYHCYLYQFKFDFTRDIEEELSRHSDVTAVDASASRATFENILTQYEGKIEQADSVKKPESKAALKVWLRLTLKEMLPHIRLKPASTASLREEFETNVGGVESKGEEGEGYHEVSEYVLPVTEAHLKEIFGVLSKLVKESEGTSAPDLKAFCLEQAGLTLSPNGPYQSSFARLWVLLHDYLVVREKDEAMQPEAVLEVLKSECPACRRDQISESSPFLMSDFYSQGSALYRAAQANTKEDWLPWGEKLLVFLQEYMPVMREQKVAFAHKRKTCQLFVQANRGSPVASQCTSPGTSSASVWTEGLTPIVGPLRDFMSPVSGRGTDEGRRRAGAISGHTPSAGSPFSLDSSCRGTPGGGSEPSSPFFASQNKDNNGKKEVKGIDCNN